MIATLAAGYVLDVPNHPFEGNYPKYLIPKVDSTRLMQSESREVSLPFVGIGSVTNHSATALASARLQPNQNGFQQWFDHTTRSTSDRSWTRSTDLAFFGSTKSKS